jgi:tetratricopeptide (TPR) repeat protein
MLDTHCNRKPEAELLYRRALEVDGKHSYALYNLAVLLEEIALDRDSDGVKGSSRQEIASLYRRAVEADTRDAASAADYGRFLLVRLDDWASAEPLLQRAVALDDQNEVGLYNLGLLNHKYKKANSSVNAAAQISAAMKAAMEMYRRLIRKNPTHLSGMLQLARLLVEVNITAKDGAPASEGLSTVSSISSQNVDSSKVQNAWMEEVVELYEQIVPKHREVCV